VADTGGLREVVPANGTASLRFRSRDSDALEKVLEQVLTDEEARAQLVAEGREHVLRFGWPDVARRTLTVYEALASKTPSRA
jgi:glycosyltransferase involved in cell wall biosynthesis